MLAGLFKRHTPKVLGRDLVSRTATGGRVPKTCFGLHLRKDKLFTLYLPGEKAECHSGECLFHLHPGPYTLTFAPHPDAPEAGVEVTLEAQQRDERLAHFMDNWEGDSLSVAALAEIARQTGGEHLLQPGMTQQEIDAKGGVRAQFSNAMQAQGFSCSAMSRIDLSDKMNTAEQLWQEIEWPEQEQVESVEADPQRGPTPTNEQRQTVEVAVALGGIASSKPGRLPYWNVAQLDERLTIRLQRELPLLTKQLAALRLTVDDPQHYRQLRHWEETLQRFAARAAMLPRLDSTIPELKLTTTQRRRRVAQLRLVVNHLRKLQQIFTDLSDGQSNQWPELEPLLYSALESMDGALRHRAGYPVGERDGTTQEGART